MFNSPPSLPSTTPASYLIHILLKKFNFIFGRDSYKIINFSVKFYSKI